jgi:CubicO group peptidase (beta-lactamase class C family)
MRGGSGRESLRLPAVAACLLLAQAVAAGESAMPLRINLISNRSLSRLFLLLWAALLSTDGYAQSGGSGASLDPILRPYLMRYDLPAVAAAIVKKGELVASGAVGTRRAGTSSPVTVEDRFHIGSDTKAMTSLIAAMLVEGGRISWSSTVSDVFPELTAHMDQGVRAVTLGQLLSHTSGIPSDTEAHEKLIQQSFAQEKRNLDELRYWIIQQLVTQPLQSEPGKQFAYANMGYSSRVRCSNVSVGRPGKNSSFCACSTPWI